MPCLKQTVMLDWKRCNYLPLSSLKVAAECTLLFGHFTFSWLSFTLTLFFFRRVSGIKKSVYLYNYSLSLTLCSTNWSNVAWKYNLSPDTSTLSSKRLSWRSRVRDQWPLEDETALPCSCTLALMDLSCSGTVMDDLYSSERWHTIIFLSANKHKYPVKKYIGLHINV